MTSLVIFLLGALRALVEVALLFLVGQGALTLLAGRRRDSNAIYRLFRIVTQPAIKLIRHVAPPQILDKHLPFVAFFVLFWCWIGLAYLRKLYCEANLLQCL